MKETDDYWRSILEKILINRHGIVASHATDPIGCAKAHSSDDDVRPALRQVPSPRMLERRPQPPLDHSYDDPTYQQVLELFKEANHLRGYVPKNLLYQPNFYIEGRWENQVRLSEDDNS